MLPTCAGAVAQSNGLLRLLGFTTGQKYQYSVGNTFDAVIAIPSIPTSIPSNSVINSTLTNTAQTFTIRVYSTLDNTCFIDRVVTLIPVICDCAPPKCVPVTIKINN